MTITEEWEAIQSLEPEEISFTVPSSTEGAVTGRFVTIDETPVALNGASSGTIDHIDENSDDTAADWQLQAACRAVPGSIDLFFSEELSDIVAAKQICAECPVIAPCLEGAISRAEPCGVWGGQLFANGRVLAQKRRRGRPPKVARPEDQLPVVPIPAHLQKLIA
ncbi:MAG: WhiB family transcriptional regulator [Acidimicrobiales bacterium]